MIAEIKIRNFKSIRQLSLDLRFTKRAPNRHEDCAQFSFFEETGVGRVVPVLGIYGPNASGKTSLVNATALLKEIVINRWDVSFFKPNKINSNFQETKDSSIGVTFFENLKKFDYSISYDQKGIVEERLRISDAEVFRVHKGELQLYGEKLVIKARSIREEFVTRCVNSSSGKQERTLLWCLRKEFPGIDEDIALAFDFFDNKLLIFPTNILSMNFAFEKLVSLSRSEKDEQKKEEAIEKVLKLLKKLDTRIEGFDYRLVPVENQFQLQGSADFRVNHEERRLERMEVFTQHKTEDNSLVTFDLFQDESRGTQKTMALVAFFLWATETGKVLMVDELDSSLHPLLATTLIGIFKERRYNRSNAQLIFTTHSTDFLDDQVLKLTEVAFVDPRFESHILKLSEIKRLRNTNDFRKRYLRGDFGGIPYASL